MMTKQEILDAIAASSELQTLALARNDGEIARILSVGKTKVVGKIITARGIASSYPGGPIASEVVLMKLEGARDSMLASTDTNTKVLGSLLRRQLGFLNGDGLDFGDSSLRGMLDQFSSLGILTATEVANLKSIALISDAVPISAVSSALNGVV